MSSNTLRVALIIGAHPIDVPATLDVFESNPEIDVYPQDLPSFVADFGDVRSTYDVAVFYNFHGHGYCVDLTDEMAEQTREAIREIGEEGLGIVPLHHGVAAFPEMEEWTDVCGMSGEITDYHFDQQFQVDVAPESHPITADLESFDFTDETYEMDEPDEESTLLLTTEYEPSMHALAWVRQYRNSRVFCYQSGHDRDALENDTFRTVLARGIRWAAGADDAVTEN